MTDIDTFADVHRWADIKIKNYLARPRHSHAVTASSEASISIEFDEAFALPANSAEARIAFAEIALDHVLRDEGVRMGPVCFVTIMPAQFAAPLGDRRIPWQRNFLGSRVDVRAFHACARREGRAANVDIHALQQLARQAMGDIPFIGIVEAALFYRWAPHRRSIHDWVSWHCHLLAWGATQPELSRVLQPLRDRHLSMCEAVSCAHVQEVPSDDLTRQLLYALKAPQKLYRVEHFDRPWVHPETGARRSPGWHLQKDWLRTGDRIRLLDVLADKHLNQLLFGNREGTNIVRAVRDEALAPFRAWEQQQPHATRRAR